MDIKITTRIDLNIGKKCNSKCKFCYYYNELNKSFCNFDFLISHLKVLRKKGINKLHITGGEPTLYKRLTELIKEAKQLGFIDIGLISNGTNLKKPELINEWKDAGLDTIAISIHGHNAEIHDSLTQTKGSFNSILVGLENLEKAGVPFSINSVITKENYRYLEDYSRLMVTLRPFDVALLNFNPMGFASKSVNGSAARYSEIAPFISKSIEILKNNNINMQFKFIPLCMINKGDEKFLTNLPQALFEDWEWDYETRFILSDGKRKYLNNFISDFKNFPKSQINGLPFKVLSYLNTNYCNGKHNYVKYPFCNDCKYDLICEGINKHYIETHGLEEFKAVKGDKIIRPDVFLNEGINIKPSLNDKILNNLLYFTSKTYHTANNIFHFSK